MEKLLKWWPIDSISESWSELNDPGIAALVKAWTDQEVELKEKDMYKQFVIRLRREWAIETGQIERLYEISDAATKILIEHGLDASLVPSSEIDKPIGHVFDLIRDQESAILSMNEFVSSGRRLTTSYIRELHSILTHNQHSSDAVDERGRPIELILKKGEWRTTPAQVTDSEGQTWLYCEPSLIESEMLNLLSFYERQESDSIPVHIQAAWLHHRFTLIHPFQDGNGRIARCLATLVLLKNHWFPLIVARNDKIRYIKALREADSRKLLPLVQLFGDLQKRAIRQALSLSENVLAHKQSLQSVLKHAHKKLDDRAAITARAYTKVTIIASALLGKVKLRAESTLQDVGAIITRGEVDITTRSADWNTSNDYYYKWQITAGAKLHGYYADLTTYKAWVELAFTTRGQASRERTILLFSFHGLGRHSKGLLCCSAVAFVDAGVNQLYNSSNDPAVELLTDVPFEFTYEDDLKEVVSRFDAWLEPAILSGVAYWTNNL